MNITEQTSAVRAARAADCRDVAAALADAFADDPVFAWCIPDATDRTVALPPFFGAFVAAFARHGHTYVAESDGAITGGALWAPPGVEAVHAADAEEFEATMGEACAPWMERIGTCVEVFDAAHPHEPAWFLQFVGVREARRGTGVGSSLLREVLAAADRAGEAAYLVATSPRNRVLYERHGFRCIEDLPLPGGPTAFSMWRDPILA
jgi:GNAT superfamily N-acetyltransferase